MTTAPGWYPDPQVPTLLRWWDGQQWTQQTAAAAGSAPTPGGYAPPSPPPASPWVSPVAPPGGVSTDFLAAAPPKRNRGWWVVGGIAAALVLIAGTTSAVIALRGGRDSSNSAAEHQANGYLSDLSRERWTSAYQRLCVSDRRVVSPSRFAASKVSHHPLSYAIGRTTIVTKAGVRTATVAYRETSSDRGAEAGALTLQYSVEGWSICHAGIDPDLWAGVPRGTGNGDSRTLST